MCEKWWIFLSGLGYQNSKQSTSPSLLKTHLDSSELDKRVWDKMRGEEWGRDSSTVLVRESAKYVSVAWNKGERCSLLGTEHPFTLGRESIVVLWCANTSWVDGSGLVGFSPKLALRTGMRWSLRREAVFFCLGTLRTLFIYHAGWQRRMMLKGL